MYLPPHFEESRPEAVAELVAEFPLGLLVTTAGQQLVADHIPLLFDPTSGESGTLRGHVARSNELWHRHNPDLDVLVVFQGPTAYITPNWYASKAETHRVVPTYNYLVAHAYGRLIVHVDEKWIRGIVGRLTKAFEATEPAPWKMADAPRKFIDDQLTRIVGVEIPVTRWIAKWKASQNRPIADLANVVSGLSDRGRPQDAAMARTIETRLMKSTDPND